MGIENLGAQRRGVRRQKPKRPPRSVMQARKRSTDPISTKTQGGENHACLIETIQKKRGNRQNTIEDNSRPERQKEKGDSACQRPIQAKNLPS